MNIVLLGQPGSGKGTQGKVLAEKYDMPMISTGDLLRRSVKERTPAGLDAKKYMDRGELVPDELVVEMITERLNMEDCRDGFILDGFPRNLEQGQTLDRTLNALNRSLDCVFNFEVGEKEVVRRLSGRRTCRKCGTVYHIIFNKPQDEKTCDVCKGLLYQRDDDEEVTIMSRLRVYNEYTAPLIEFYKEKNILKTIDGEGKLEVVRERITGAISEINDNS